MGNLLAVKVYAANIVDTMSGCHVYQAVKKSFRLLGVVVVMWVIVVRLYRLLG